MLLSTYVYLFIYSFIYLSLDISKQSMRKLLKKIQNRSEMCSDMENSVSENVQMKVFIYLIGEETNTLNVLRGQKHQKILSDFKNERNKNVHKTEVALDETVWQQIKSTYAAKKFPYNFKEILVQQDMLKEISCSIK